MTIAQEFADLAEAVRPVVPEWARRPIAVIGAGAIVDVAHLPAYRDLRLPVVGIHDIDRGRAEAVAARHGIPRVYDTLEELLADDRVEVVDIAVPAARQPEVATPVIESGRHVLAQKPFALSLDDARAMVAAAERAGTVLAVNQQLRYDEGIAAAHEMIARGWIGTPTAMSITVDIWTEWSDWPWLLEVPRLEIMNHSIHYHDTVRWFLGEPERVFCAAGRSPEQRARGETRTISTYRYPDGVTALVHAHHLNGHGDNRAEFRIDGTNGALRGTLGLLYDYPHGRPDTLEISSTVLPTDGWLPYPVTRRWIPDAFGGPMASVLIAAGTGDAPATDGHDNLRTLALTRALYRSIETGATTVPSLAD